MKIRPFRTQTDWKRVVERRNPTTSVYARSVTAVNSTRSALQQRCTESDVDGFRHSTTFFQPVCVREGRIFMSRDAPVARKVISIFKKTTLEYTT
jgi:hypothetical protein